MPQIEVKSPQGQRRYELPKSGLTIGRSDDNKLVLQDDRASRHHCVIEPRGGDFLIRDLKSRNGTKLNNIPLAEPASLQNGDVVRIGKTEITFIDPEAVMKLSDPVKATRGENPPATRHTLDLDVRSETTAKTGKVANWEDQLNEVIKVGEDRGFTEAEISLVDNRGEVVHRSQADHLQLGTDKEDAEGTRAFRKLLHAAFRTRATDIHIEPRVQICVARMRVDGTMISAVEFSPVIFKRILGIVKILCQIETSQKNQVQDGHFSVSIRERRVDYRVSLTPSVHGQKLVIRVLDSSNSPSRLHELGLKPWMYEKIRTLAIRDAGLILACGPTGSGKTTTLYTCLREIDVDQRNAITIEDPVEYYLEGCTQIPVDHDQGTTFHSVLRSVLRQDPDVIFVGEIRDIETANVAMQASMTGHLVYTTIHAKDTIGAIFRLLDLGIDPPLLANALNLIVAQRLIRLLCPHCRKGVIPTPTQTLKMGQRLGGLPEIFIPQSCPLCLSTGYHGRRALFELLEITDSIRDMIMKTPTIKGIRELAQQGLFTTLEDFGFELVSEGLTSYEEIERVSSTD
ncbi:MAG: hypothetical protein CMJ29_09085 [Phycisphaerae bacterium]|nr:hypothetical protein [Phycisphaerae bacterium]